MQETSPTNRLETWLHDIFKESSRLNAKKICRDYLVPERLGLTGIQVDLFRAYFAAYYSLQDAQDMAYLARHPGSEALSRLPILKLIPAMSTAICRASQTIADEFFASAKTIAETIKTAASDLARISAKRTVTEHFHIDDSRYAVWVASEPEIDRLIEALSEKLLQSIGTPAEIRNAANLLSSTYVAHKKSSRQELDEALEKTLNRIKIGSRAPHLQPVASPPTS